MIEINISKDVLLAMNMFTAPTSKKLDPRCAVHVQMRDEFSLRLAATNGREIAMLRLVKEGDLLKDFYWELEEEPIISIPLGLAFGVNDMGKMVLVRVAHTYIEIKPYALEGDDTIERSVRVPRIRAIQRNLFTDFQEIPPVSFDEMLPRRQLVVSPKTLNMFCKAAKKLDILNPEQIALAQLDGAYGITIGSHSDFWGLTPCETTVAPMVAGLPPDWVTGEPPAEEAGTFTARIAALLGEQDEEDGEQGTIVYDDEDAPAENGVQQDEEAETDVDADEGEIDAPAAPQAEVLRPSTDIENHVVAFMFKHPTHGECEALRPLSSSGRRLFRVVETQQVFEAKESQVVQWRALTIVNA